MDKKPQIIKYTDYEKEIAGKNIVCPFCGFSSPENSYLKEYYKTIIFDVSCPKCDKMLYVVPYDVDYEKYLKSTKNTNKGTKKTKKRSAFDVPKDHFDGYYKLGHMAISHFHGTVGEGKVNGKVDKNFGGEAYVAVLTEGEKITKEEYDALSDQSPQEEKIKYKKLTNAQKSRFSAWKRKVHNLPEKPGEAFYSAQELADKLGYNVMTIYRYIKAGKLKAYKVGKEFRIDREEFDKFLEYVRKNKE